MQRILVLFFFFSITHSLYSQCPVGTVTLNSQVDVESYISNFGACEVINGDLIIRDATDISGITALKRIEGSLIINYSEITSVSNFNNLEFIGGDFEIDQSHQIETIEGINKLHTIKGDFNITSNYTGLKTITGFNLLETVEGKFQISDNHSLETISDFDSLLSVGGWFLITRNDSLLSLSTFISLREVGLNLATEGNFALEGNDALLAIDGFDALETIGWDLSIGNSSLVSIQGFSNLKKVTRFFNISGYNDKASPNLVSMPLFNSLEVIGAGFQMANSGLSQLSGFDSLTAIGSLNTGSGWFILGENDKLITINGFNNLNHIYGVVQIYINNSLESILGFNQLSTVGGLFSIGGNPSLTTLAGLESLTQVAGPDFENDNALIIESNTSLVDCSAICNLLNINGVTGLIRITGNPSKCSSETEVREECIPDFDNDGILNADDLDDDNDGILDSVEQNGDINRDTDNDNYPDHQDLDSDNDGCFDVIESGFTDNDTNGTLGNLPDTVDVNGLIIGEIDGYTIPIDIDVNGVYDFQENTILSAGEDANLEICIDNSSVNLLDSLTGADTGGLWSPSLTSGTGVFDPAMDSAGVYTYTVTNGICGSDTSEVSVTIDVLPNAGEDGNLDICVNSNSVNLFDSLAGMADTGGVWTPSLASGTGVFDPSIDAAGTYTYTTTNGACGSDTSEVIVTIDVLPNAGEDNSLDICINSSSVDLFDSLTGADTGGVWTPSLTSGTSIFDPAMDSAGVYTYTVTNGVCDSDISEVSITIDVLPNAGEDGDLDICVDSNSVNLFDSLIGADTSGVWSPNLTSGTGIFDPAMDSAGVYTYTVTNGVCGSDSSEVSVTIDVLPNAGEDGDLDICINSSSVNLFDSLTGTADIGGVWTPSLTSGTGVFNPSMDSAGVYTYSVTNGVCGSVASEVNVVITTVDPITDYEIVLVELEDNNSIEVIINDDLNYEYSIDAINFQNSNIFTGLAGGQYTVTAIEIDGCRKLEVVVFLMAYPPYFTPNQDGYHDYWELKGMEQEKYTLTIYDRFGKILKTLDHNNRKWDGIFNGDLLPTNDYWFYLTLENGIKKTGHFTLKN